MNLIDLVDQSPYDRKNVIHTCDHLRPSHAETLDEIINTTVRKSVQ